jgi:ATP synthase protein I
MKKPDEDKRAVEPANSAFARRIGVQADRKLDARRHPEQGVWFGLGMMGLIGWSVVVPTLAGAALGAWLDRHLATTHSWALALMAAGLVLGCANAWRWVARQDREMHARSHDEHGGAS